MRMKIAMFYLRVETRLYRHAHQTLACAAGSRRANFYVRVDVLVRTRLRTETGTCVIDGGGAGGEIEVQVPARRALLAAPGPQPTNRIRTTA